MRVLVTIPAPAPALADIVEVVRGPIGSARDAVGMLVGPTERVGDDDLALMPRLRVLAVAGAGTDAVDADALASRGVQLVSAPSTTADPTAEMSICLALMVSRGVRAATAELTAGTWPGWSFDHIVGRGLGGLTLGLVGYGRIGRRVSELASAFGMHVIHHARRETGATGYLAHLHELLALSDIVSLHVPLTPQTANLIDHEAIATMRPGAALINTSRGGIVDEPALVAALTRRHLSGAGLDVFSEEPSIPRDLLAVPNLVVTPHIGTATEGARAAMVREASIALLRALEQGSADGG